MTHKFLLAFTTIALAAASAASHRVTLFQPTTINGTDLKPGEYRVEVKDGKLTVQNGRQTAEANVTVESADTKFNATSVRYRAAEGKNNVEEIRLGGTKTRLVIAKDGARPAAE